MGLHKIAAVQDRGFKVFADAKIAEIPDKVLEIAKLHLVHRPWMLNVMAGICSTGIWAHEDRKKVDGLKRFADLCQITGTRPCAVTVLTSKSEDMVLDEFNGRMPEEQVLFYADLLLEAGFTDMVCSPREARLIRDNEEFDALELNCPGIRLPGSGNDDQARVETPLAAIAAFRRVDANLNPDHQGSGL